MSKRNDMHRAEVARIQKEEQSRAYARDVDSIHPGSAMRAGPLNVRIDENGDRRVSGEGYFELIKQQYGVMDPRGKVRITPYNAERVQPFYIAQSRLCDTLATLPLKFFRRRRDGTKMQLVSDPRQRIIDDELNRWTIAQNWRWSMWWAYGTYGRAVTRLVKNPVLEIPTWGEFLSEDSGTLDVKWTADGPVYVYTRPNGYPVAYGFDEIMDLRMSSKDVVTPISYVMANEMGMKLSYYLERFGARYFEDAGLLSGLVKVREGLSEEEEQNLFTEMTDSMTGAENNFRVGLLQHDADYVELKGKSAEQTQFVQSRAHQNAATAAGAGVPPHLAGEMTRSTYSNIYQQSSEFSIFMVAPRCIALEKTLRLSMLTDIEKASEERFFFKHNLSALLRGDPEVRYRNYEIATQGARPFMSINDVRGLEDMDPIPGGDELVTNPDSVEEQEQMAALRAAMQGADAALSK